MITSALRLRRLTPGAAALLLVAAVAWVLTVRYARGMNAMPGAMGLNLPAFVGVWALMMTAMMLPSVVPMASMYTRSFATRRAGRTGALAVGYLAVWSLAAVPAYALAWLAGGVVSGRPAAATAMAVVIFAAAGIYQLTPLKDRCLAKCRSPIGQLLYYGSFRGRFRDVRVGAHHGAFCLGCCWALMALLIAFGLMNLVAMVGLAAVVLIEKVWARGVRFSRLLGVAALGLAVAVIFVPALAPGLHPVPPAMGPMS